METYSNPLRCRLWSGVLGTLCLLFPGQTLEAATFSDANWISTGGIPGASGAVADAVVDSSGNLYIGGEFTLVGNVVANRIAKWNGTNWSALGAGVNNTVYSLAVSGSNLYVGGVFTTAGGLQIGYGVAKWNGKDWSALGSGMNNSVVALAVWDDELYAGGDFTTAGGNPANRIAKWNGSDWSTLGSGMNNTVHALAVSGSDLYAGGDFTTAGGDPASRIAKWNGSNWNALASGMAGGPIRAPTVQALAVSGSDLYVGGGFTAAGGSAANRVARWNGSNWSSLGLGVSAPDSNPDYGGFVSALVVSNGDLYAGGRFTTAGGNAANQIAKWNGSNWSALGSGIVGGVLFQPPAVFALAVSDNDLFAGGRFTTAGGKASAYVARAVLGDAPGYNQLTRSLLSGGAMKFSYIGYPATNYALDRAFNLAPPINWVGQKTNTMTISGVLMFTNSPVPGTNNFWRVRSVP